MDVVGNLVLKGLGQIKNARVENLAVDPVAPGAGTIWYNTTDGVYRGFDGTIVTTFATGGNTALILAKLDQTISSEGLNADGTLPSLAGTTYLTASPTLFAALVALDTQAKSSADAITAANTAAGNLSTKVEAVIVSEGLNADGTFAAYTGTSYLNAATSGHNADVLLDTQVKANADGIATNVAAIATKVSKAGDAMTGNLAFGGVATVTGLAAPVNAADAATKNYVDNTAAGLSWKQPVVGVVAAVADFATAVVVGDRVLNSTDFKIYTATAAGEDGATASFDAGVLMVDGDAVFDKSTETGYVFSGTGIVQFTGGGQIVAGVGLVKTGNQLDINMGAGIGQLPTDEVGIDILSSGGLFLTVDGVAASTDTAAQLSVLIEGSTLVRSATGLKVAAAGVTETELSASVAGAGLVGGAGSALAVNAGTGITVTGDAVTFDTTFGDARYLTLIGGALTGALTLAADPTVALGAATKQYVDVVKAAVTGGSFLYTAAAADTSHVVNHNIGSKYNSVTVVNAFDEVIIPDSITFNSANQLTVGFISAISCKVYVGGLFVPA